MRARRRSRARVPIEGRLADWIPILQRRPPGVMRSILGPNRTCSDCRGVARRRNRDRRQEAGMAPAHNWQRLCSASDPNRTGTNWSAIYANRACRNEALYQVLMILTHRDVFSELSARSLIRSDAGHRKGRATRSERSEKTQALSTLGRVGGRQQALEMSRIACGLLPTRRGPGAIPMGQYHQDLV